MENTMRKPITHFVLTILLLVASMAVMGSINPAPIGIQPSVTINLAAGQADPTSTAPIHFTVVFSEVVSDFVTGDIDLSASTAPGDLIGAVTGSGATYDIAVTGMAGSGTVVPVIEANIAHDAMGYGNTASTSSYNSVTYDGTALSDAWLANAPKGPAPPTISAPPNVLINMGTSTDSLAFRVGDIWTGASTLIVTGASSNTALVHAAGIVLTGPSAMGYCRVVVTPVAIYSGMTTISLTVTDTRGLSAKTTFTLTVNGPPKISTIAPQIMNIDTTSVFDFTISDDLTPAGALSVTALAGNSMLFPAIRIILGGSGAARTVKVTPAAGSSGTANIYLIVTDGGGLTTKMHFAVTVNAPPTITALPNVLINMGTSTPSLAFRVGDELTPASLLTVTGVSSNTALVKTAHIVLTAPSALGYCRVVVTPVPDYSGRTTIILTVTDAGGLTAKTAFVLTVNGRPKITPITDRTILLGSPTSPQAFSVSDDLTAVRALKLTIASSNLTLVPAANITLTAVDALGNGSVTVKPVTGRIGVATITLTATDSGGLKTTTSFLFSVLTISPANPTAPPLGEAARFVILASQKITTTGVTALSNGDLGIEDQARSYFAGFTPGASAGQFDQLTNGLSYAPDDVNPLPYAYPLHYAAPHAPYATTGAMLTQSKTDLGIASTFLAHDPNPSAPTQVCPIELGEKTLTRGVYKTGSNVSIMTGTLHLDALGDPNSVWIFSIDGTLTTGAPGGSIVLENGAQAKNVYWRTGGKTVIGAGTAFYGNVFAWSQVNVLAGAHILGRLFAVTGQVTLIANTVTKP